MCIYIYIYTLRRYESLTHFTVVVKSVCGGYLACGLSAALWRVVSNPPSPLDTYLVKGCPGACTSGGVN